VFEGRRRSSLRVRVAGAILFVAIAPLLFVFLWSQVDRSVPGERWRVARDAAKEAAALARGTPMDEARLRQLATARHVRLRVMDEQGEPLLDEDRDLPSSAFDGAERFFLGHQDLPLAENLDEERGPMMLRPEIETALKTGFYVACSDVPVVVCQAIAPARTAEGALRVVHVVTSSRRSVDAVYALRYQILRLSFVTLPLGILLAWLTARRIVRPIEILRRQALERAARERPGAALDLESKDEVGSLADAFNVLLRALEERRIANESFVADLVHEMKTPVAAMRAAAESLESGPVERERTDRLARVLSESTGKLDRLVTQFLELARAEAGMPNEDRSLVDLQALLSGMLGRMRDDARHASISFDLTMESPGPLVVRGVEHRLESVFRELLENAASFSGESRHVRVNLRRLARLAVVEVCDSGPGIPAEHLSRVFTRFFTTRGGERGTGLGLALVRAVVEAHDGSVEADSVSGEGARFAVRLPLP
jgi:signal transduction histidine kinase